MTTSSPDNSSTTPSEPAAQQPEGRRRWNSATSVALAVAVVGAVAAAVLSPLGEHVVNAFLDEPACPGEACEGKNPGRQGCDDGATTFKPAAGNPAELSIRYSEDCQAVWGKIERGAKGDLVTVEATGGTKRAAEIGYGDDQYTPHGARGRRRVRGHRLRGAQGRRREHVRALLHPRIRGDRVAVTDGPSLRSPATAAPGPRCG
ncbi:DUF2690 domain-containing protein [Streptomyces pseudogriseolus]|uniref:DUF2690 domain-containing protein n=1 Tax=Streptomyces pseudogriseolus TaxID=36817 RepID=UPI001CE35A6F|nr:DUF2690 domain-containing protein [Streptomyces pseudogriseolus]